MTIMEMATAALSASAEAASTTELSKIGLFCLGAAVTMPMLRLSVDFIQTASENASKDYKEDHHNASAKRKKSSSDLKNYGSIPDEEEPLVEPAGSSPSPPSSPRNTMAVWSFYVQLLMALLLGSNALFRFLEVLVLPPAVVWTAFVVVAMGSVLAARDKNRQRFGRLQHTLYFASACALWLPAFAYYRENKAASARGAGDTMVVVLVSFYAVLSLGESIVVATESKSGDGDETCVHRKKTLSRAAMVTILKPYFWPDATNESAVTNRLRAMLTWVFVFLSKSCNIASPLFLGWASTALAHADYGKTIEYSITYALIQFMGSTFKQAQSLVYLKVAQAAFVQLSETAFVHLHSLSLDWHLQKKLGEVTRSIDRGVTACDTLMKYLFLWLVPALAECVVVCIIFATYFQYLPMALAVFYFVWMYIVWTVLVTLWRKKFRKTLVKSDNDWHDKFVDSLLNFETVKYFTAEEYERERFGLSLRKYSEGSINVQGSLALLNISQQLILQVCLAVSLSMAVFGIKQRIGCCIDHGCDSGVSDCCQAIDADTCPGMQVGDFVAVLTYVFQLFQPLNFLGSVYNAVVMATIDLTNLSELLAERPDVQDAPDALSLPDTNHLDPDIAVEFDNVFFHYPTQPENKGLKGISFKMKRGTTTAVVGPTGAGKTTISRLFFRFYDVLGGAIKVNGMDVRTVSQKTLREAVGVVPQNACMFNDTIRANLRYGGRDSTQEDLDQAARDAQLLSFITSLDDGWDTRVGDRGMKLSGGEQQRAAIARCLLKDPPFVLLDEATSALDTITEKSIQEALDRLGDHRTVLVIAHRLGTIRNADNILVLKDGVVAEEGTHDDLLAMNGVYAEMWNLQLHSTN